MAGCFLPGLSRADFSATNKTVYVVATAHLDDQWNWTILSTINSYLPATLHGNFALFEKYPHYTFSFEESFRYKLVKEYYPADYLTLSNYVAAGRWRVAGATVVAGDVLVPSPESLIREVLYSSDYWTKEFGVTPVDLFLPDCFGFPYSLPSVAAHCGLKGFSTQKLQAKTPMIPIPFQNLGKWVGVDSNSVVASLQPGSYHTTLADDLSTDATAVARVNSMGAASGLYVDYMYFGLGDTGGAPDETSVKLLEQAGTNTAGSIKVVSAGSDQLFRDLSAADISQLPVYQGELLMKYHGAGCYTAHSEMKRYQRQNEQRADAAERAAVIADWLQGGGTYPQTQLNPAWERFLSHTFHDDLTGTSIDAAYNFSWNDELLSLNEFKAVETQGAGVLAKALDTTAQGVPLLVFNPLAIEREDVVETLVKFTNGLPAAIQVCDENGAEVPSQTGPAVGDSLPVTFVAKVPGMGAAVFDVRPSPSPSALATGLAITTSQLENAKYRVQLNAVGDVVSIFDKSNHREMLRSPIRWAEMYDASTTYPVWEILYPAVTGTPVYLGGQPTFTILENGPARVSLGVTRCDGASTFTERIRLAAGAGGDRVEWNVSANWGTRQTLLKVVFPLAVTNTLATYDLGLGTIQRPNNTADAYEVPAQQWADLTAADGSYGGTILSDCKYGWDKPDSSTLRLTIFHTPDPGGSGYGSYQKNNDLGCHEFSFALVGHPGDWRAGHSFWAAARLNQPFQAFQTAPHAGTLGKTFSWLSGNNSNVMVKAVKRAENSDEIIVRLQEMTGQPQTVQISCAGAISAAREVNGVEAPLRSLSPSDGKLTVSLGAYSPLTLALTLTPNVNVPVASALPLSLPYNLDAVSSDASRTDGNFDSGCTYPAELLPASLVRDGIYFQFGPTTDGALNAVACQGQTITLGGAYDRLYILAAAATNDLTGIFTLNGQATNSTSLTVRYFSGFIGQWNPPSLKKDEVAWVGTHRHTGGGTNDAYRFCYLFKYGLALPPGATSVTLPNVPGLRIFAMSLATNTTAETVVAGGALADRIAPWANAGTNQTVSVGTGGTAAVTLNGSGSRSIGSITSFVWSENGVPLATNSQTTVSLTVGSHLLLLTVTDDQGATAQDGVLVAVVPPPSSGVWLNPNGGDWINTTNWSGGAIASGSGGTADFSTLTLARNVVVALGDAWTAGNLIFDDQASIKHVWSVTAGDANPLTLSAGSVAPMINASAPVVLNLPLTTTNGFTKTGSNSLTFAWTTTSGTGPVNLLAGSLNFAGNSSYAGAGNFNLSNGVFNITTPGSVSSLNFLELGGLLNNTKDAGVGVVNQTSGTVNVGASGTYAEIGVGANAYGSYQLSGGSLNLVSASGMRVGASGSGVFNQSGGALDCARYFAVGSGTGGSAAGGGRGVATFTGGTAVLGSGNYRVILGDKTSSTAVLNLGTQAGGYATVTAASTATGNWGIELLDVAGATMSAVLNLNAGTLRTVGPIWRNTANTTGSAWLNFNGGTLQAGAGQTNLIFSTLTAVNVYLGGAVLDTQGYSVTNSAPLLGALGQGIYPLGGTLAVVSGGSGYPAPPLVTVSGGSGSNALAVANISGGTITSVTMTCPGQSFQAGNVVSFAFTGGGATTPANSFTYVLPAGDLAPNSTGGLIKLGSGRLTLAATNTFGGDTIVSNGTLTITGRLLGNGTVSVRAGTLSGSGVINGPVTVDSGATLAPGGGATAALTISNRLTLLPGAVCFMSVNRILATNDVVQGVTQLNFGGTLVVSNSGPSLTANDSFKLFGAEQFSGNFSTLIPAAPGDGLAWNTSKLNVNGTLGIVSLSPVTLTVAVTNRQLSLSWPADHTGWRLELQTNRLAVGLTTSWTTYANAAATNAISLPVTAADGCTFFRLVYP